MQKEEAANPPGLITKLGGDEFEVSSHLMIPDFIELVSTHEEEDEEEEGEEEYEYEEEEVTTNQTPETPPSFWVCNDAKFVLRLGKGVADVWARGLHPEYVKMRK